MIDLTDPEKVKAMLAHFRDAGLHLPICRCIKCWALVHDADRQAHMEWHEKLR